MMMRIFISIGLLLLLVSCREIVQKEADDKLARAEEALHEERWDAANESFHEAALLDPDRADAWIGLGITLTQLGELDEARIHYKQALLICQKRLQEDAYAMEPLRKKLMLLILLDQTDEAHALVDEVVGNHPDREFAEKMPQLVQTLEREFQEMIIPVSLDSYQTLNPFD